ncbi:MAG: pyruvate:ferredoxin (flavodoxin) oxidoreductase [Candidatus Aminicenantes bacterium]|nr:pyruvate:ferredoxin (flavodoxin) oxidoreductase [Candidatus Aminicenantes bacterium]NIM85035.1 pyruvate:ferredoxin (flavodoxin) oxidoreductase [Candidatus Aminicenantes bacterium]NIN24549.1 pyruvate:ferredoxin (flavodoxin) oxidoreductase [Candidatus Aminicenantes bacterium]NIN48313.1 pyruvate:ferredoxin (flavodoxin) oxidoreductase [Candidatus Aminicenantes bacterium]NIN91216.1 pyruvate:ferredoxin (flavodoxin) oxidoreductase [Candidatus Aminicenantes bacterium]
MSANETKSMIDGNTAASHVAYAFSEIAAIYPITPSSPMGELADEWSAYGRKNIFGQELEVIEMQSEGGAAGAVHGALSAGSLTTTFTASQGLLLMIPNMHKIAGEMLPTVFHVSARSLACQSLSIFGDHSDVMCVRNTGWGLMAAGSIQEVMDLGVVSHLATLESWVPFLNFFDGFRTSHEIQKVDMINYNTMGSMLDMKHVETFRKRAMTPDNPILKVGAQNPDVYFQGRETVNPYYEKTPGIVQKYMDLLAKKLGRQYHLFDYFGAPDAEKMIIIMASGAETVEETINYLNKKGEKVGLIKVRLYRPFSNEALVNAIPDSVNKIAVLDRTKEPGAPGEPLYLDVVNALRDSKIKIIGGRYGLSSKEFTPSMVKAVFDHLDDKGFHDFTVGITDDVTHKSVPVKEIIDTESEDVTRCIFWGLGADGTVGANKNSIKIIGENTDMYAQGYFSYDSKKSGGITISHLRFGKSKIQSPYLISKADFIALHNPAYIGRYDVLKEIKAGGIFLLNSEWSNEEVFNRLPRDMQETIIKKKIKFYNIDALKIAKGVGLGSRISTVMQAAFFIISGILEKHSAIKLIKESIEKTFKTKGEHIVKMNWEAVDKTEEALQQVKCPERIDEIAESHVAKKLIPEDAGDFAKNVIEMVMHLRGDEIPVSHMPLDGKLPTGTSKLEKRGIAPMVPRWNAENCILCNQCSMVCPHAAIRAKQIEPGKLTDAPPTFKTIKSNTKNEKNLQFKVQVYIEDCTGCGNCLETCPVNKKGTDKKALEWSPIEEERNAGENANFVFFDKLPDNIVDGTKAPTFRWSQFRTPLFEFSGACAGCGETPYVKLLSQLFGERMIIANATGCSSIYGGYFPTTPYAQSKAGRGPTWANSLFEDNAEYGFGMRLAVDSNRKQLKWNIDQLLEKGTTPELTTALKKNLELWKNTDDDAQDAAQETRELLPAALKAAPDETKPNIQKIMELGSYFVDKSVWSLGGDGWAYDIGYGGLDHVLASTRNLNILVLDTEVYSNTGGQASKATPLASVAKFAAAGKRTGKKDLGLISMSYGHIYVASVCLGANMNQVVKAFLEAESYDGPSLIIAYSPCIAHGIDMGHSIEEEKRAVDCGYWSLYRYDPRRTEQGENPFIYETKDPKTDMLDFLMGETRYKTLKWQFPEVADKLYERAVKFKKDKHEFYKKL